MMYKQILLAFYILYSTGAFAGNPCEDISSRSRLLNPAAAEDWACLTYQAKQGDPATQYFVGMSLLAGGTPDGYRAKEGIDWLEKAATQNYENAQKNLSQFYFKGKHVEKNIRKAYLWYVLAKKQNKNARIEWLHGIEDMLPAAEKDAIRKQAMQRISPK